MRIHTRRSALTSCMATARTRLHCPCTAQNSSILAPNRYRRSLLSACKGTMSCVMAHAWHSIPPDNEADCHTGPQDMAGSGASHRNVL
jgi:hypothetical protein